MRISDWSSDVCSSDLENRMSRALLSAQDLEQADWGEKLYFRLSEIVQQYLSDLELGLLIDPCCAAVDRLLNACVHRSEEHTYELQSLMRISYDVFCSKKKNIST